MNKNTVRSISGGVLHFGVWAAAQLGVTYALSSSPSSYVYGLITAWWAALYVGYVFGIRFSAVLTAALLYVITVVIDHLLSMGFLYHDRPESFTVGMLIVYTAQLLVLISPIIINHVVRTLNARKVQS